MVGSSRYHLRTRGHEELSIVRLEMLDHRHHHQDLLIGATHGDLGDVEQVRREFEERCRAIGRKVALIVNYDRFELDPAVADAYFSTVAYLQDRYYETASRYTTSAFLRLKLGDALAKRALAPHVFETLKEAQASAAAP